LHAAGRASAGRTACVRVSFGGVAFELLSEDALQHDLVAEDARYWQLGADPRAIADVVCAVRVETSAPGDTQAPIDLCFRNDGARGATIIDGRSLHAELSEVGPRRYAAAVQITRSPEALVGMLRGIAAAVVHREGGLMLHAAGVELEGRAVLFLGPSGAGKSTAARLSHGARCFAYDHVAVVPGSQGFIAWGLPGGTPARAPLASSVAYPLGALLRVRKSGDAHHPSVHRLCGAQALFALRESVEWADLTPGGEDVYLHAVTQLSTQIPVGAIETVLDRPHGSLLRALLREHFEAGPLWEARKP
jgi:hypothetical protein